MVRIAAASTDGKVINEHYGRADRFYILEADEEEYSYRVIEIRNVDRVCINGEHEEDMMKKRTEELSDCQYVLVSRIGMRAASELETSGIKPYEIPGIIDESVERMLRYIKVQNMFSGL